MTSFAVSVPVGAYHPFLPFCLKSLKAQSVPVQIALLDASGDSRVKALADLHSDAIVYRRHGPDDGQSAAIVEGWENVDGEILAWLNADDVLFPHAFERAVPIFERGADVVCAHSVVTDEAGATTGYHWGVGTPGPSLLKSNVISQPSCFFRRDVCQQIGGLDEDLHYTMDWDLWIRLYQSEADFHFVDDTFSQVMWGRKTKTASFNRFRRDEIREILSKYTEDEEQSHILNAFARESWIDRLPIAYARAVAGRFLARGRPLVRGFSGIGEISSGAGIPLVHYLGHPVCGIKIKLSNASAVEKVWMDGEVCDVQMLRGALLIDAPISPSTVTILKFQLKSDKSSRFIKAEWV